MNRQQIGELIKQRKEDIAQYQINIDNYISIVSMIPSWPEYMLPYRSSDPISFIDKWSFEDILLLSDLQFKDKLERTLLAERLEQRKSALILLALEQKLNSE